MKSRTRPRYSVHCSLRISTTDSTILKTNRNFLWSYIIIDTPKEYCVGITELIKEMFAMRCSLRHGVFCTVGGSFPKKKKFQQKKKEICFDFSC